MSPETASPSQPSLKDWWKTAFESEIYKTLIPAERGPEVLDVEMRLLPEWLQLKTGQSVLDLACGDGRLAVPLATAGYQVVGVDQSPRLLAGAKQYLAETQQRLGQIQGRLDLIQGDMRSFQLPQPVDAAVCVFVSFGLFLDEADHLRTLQATANALKPGGRLYLEVFNPQYFVWPGERVANKGDLVIVYQSVLDQWKGRVNSQILFAQVGQAPQTITLSWRAFALWEIVRLLDAAGFSVLQVTGGMKAPEEFVPLTHSTLGILAEKRAEPAEVA